MTAATSALIPSTAVVRRGRRRHQERSSRVGQIANPVPKLKEARNPANTTIAVDVQELRAWPIKRKASAAPLIAKELSQLNSPLAVMVARPIQKLPTRTTSVHKVFPVRLTVLSRQTGIRSSDAVIKSSPNPAKKSVCESPWKKRKLARQMSLGKNFTWLSCLSRAL